MGIIPRQDVSYLFSNMGSSSNNIMDCSWLSDYASIKNGSYSKLVKAYYSKDDTDSKTVNEANKNDKYSTSLSKDDAKKLADIKSSSDDLKESALKLISKGKDSLFTEKDIVTKNEDGTETKTKGYDMEAVYKEVSSFVNSYNKLLDSVSKSEATSIKSTTDNMTNITKLYENTLKGIGIAIGEDNRLTIDDKAFKAADAGKVKSAFNGTHSFAASVSSQASFVNSAATREATKANTYTDRGQFSNNFSTGDLFSSLF